MKESEILYKGIQGRIYYNEETGTFIMLSKMDDEDFEDFSNDPSLF